MVAGEVGEVTQHAQGRGEAVYSAGPVAQEGLVKLVRNRGAAAGGRRPGLQRVREPLAKSV